MKVRKRFAHVGVELPDTSLIGGGSGLGGVIHEIVREEFFENIEVPFALDLFGILADNGFRGFRRGDAVHFANLFYCRVDLGDRLHRFRGQLKKTRSCAASITAGLLNSRALLQRFSADYLATAIVELLLRGDSDLQRGAEASGYHF
jgi:hypothetical protein